MGKTIKQLAMTPCQGIVKDINLYVIDEKTLYSKPHNHTFFEFMLITQGKIRQIINGEERILSEYDICFLRPETSHQVIPCENESVVFYNFEVNVHYLQTLCEALGFHSVEDIFTKPVAYTSCTAAEAMNYIKIITIPSTRTNLMCSDVKETSLKIIVARMLMRFILDPAPLLSRLHPIFCLRFTFCQKP